MISDTVGPILHNHAALLRRPAAAAPAPAPAVLSHPATAREVGGKGRGAGRIPCPPPVAIGSSSLLPGALPHVPYIAGLDKLIVSFWLEGAGFDKFRRELQAFKEEFHDEQLCGPDVSERAFDLGWEGVSFNMSRAGASTYPYKLQSGDIVLLFSNHRSTASQPNCRIEIHSMSCWNPGWRSVLGRFRALLDHIGGEIRRETVTEHHITVDLIGVDYAKTGLIDHRRWLTKAPKKISPTYEYYRPNYISFGKGDFMLRCYDKPADLKNDPAKREFFHQLWFDRLGHVPEHVTRIEFQIRRAVSKDLEVNTLDDLERKLDGIWQYCTTEWCRFCDRELTDSDRRNKHQSRYSTAFLWEFVRSVRFTGQAEPAPVIRQKLPPQINLEQLRQNAAGCLLSLCAASGLHPDDFQGHIAFSQTVIAEQIPVTYKKNRKEYVRKMETKRNQARVSLFN